MTVTPLAGDVEPPPSGGRHEQGDAAVVRPEMRAAPREDAEKQAAEETIEEPGYGHGV